MSRFQSPPFVRSRARGLIIIGVSLTLAGCHHHSRYDDTTPASPKSYSIGGTVNGLTASGLTLANGGDTLTVASGASSFKFANSVSAGTAYTVTVQAQPTGLQCTVTKNSGKVDALDITDLSVTCQPNTFSVGGSITGLTSAGLILANNGGDNLTVTSGASSFKFATSVLAGAAYAVTVQTQPTGLRCTVTKDSGKVDTLDITDVSVTCQPNTFNVGGSITGLTSVGLILANNGGDNLTVAKNSSAFTMATPVLAGNPYAITIKQQPQGSTCSITQGSGTVSSPGVTSVAISCALWSTYTYTVVKLLGYAYDNPNYPLQDQVQTPDGSFYGTTGFGGTAGSGTIYKIAPDGTVTKLHSFDHTHDGDTPMGLTLGSDDNLYGLTQGGGSNNSGTVFKTAPDGTFTTLATLSPSTGSNPQTSFVLANDGNLYSVAPNDGAHNNGTIIKVTNSGTLTVVYDFTGGADGGSPSGGLVQGADGALYGTTMAVGAGHGTIFRITTAGALTTLHTFNGTDGETPQARLTLGSDGNFYGTTQMGGTDNLGTIFKIAADGTFTQLWAFSSAGSSLNGEYPTSALLEGDDGLFYGTTQTGGVNGMGSIFKITANGQLTKLHDFDNHNQGEFHPQSRLIRGSDGNFYGTASEGGAGSGGAFFRLTPQ